MPLLELAEAGVRIDGVARLAGLSFRLERGETLGIAGGAGAGKSLLALLVAGLLPRGATVLGGVRFEDRALPVDEAVRARLRGNRIGFLFGDGRAALDPALSIGRHLDRLATRAPRAPMPAALLDSLGLADAAGRFVHQLDADQRRRALLGVALARGPDLVVADDPAHGLDPVAARRLLETIIELQRTMGFALLLMARDYRAVALSASAALMLEHGRIIEAGPPERLFGRPQQEATRRLVAASRLRMRTLARPPIGADLLLAEALQLRLPDGPGPTVSFTVRRGETLAIVGRSGTGKSRLGRTVAGLEAPRDGRLIIATSGKGGPAGGRRGQVALIDTNVRASFDPGLPVGAALAEPLRHDPQLLHDEQEHRLLEVVRALDLDPQRLALRPTELDLEELTRLALARALLMRPHLVVIDEPGAGVVDLVQRHALLELLARLRSDFGLSYLLLSRDIEVARDLADRVLILDSGAIVEAGKPFDLIDSPTHPATQALVAARLPEVWTMTPAAGVPA